jgi:hypothetical protein
LEHFHKHLASSGSTWCRKAEAASLGNAAAAVWPLGTWSSSTEVSSTDSAEDSVEKLSTAARFPAKQSASSRAGKWPAWPCVENGAFGLAANEALRQVD